MNNKKCWVWAIIFIIIVVGGFYWVITNQLNQINQVLPYDGLNVIIDKSTNKNSLEAVLPDDWQLMEWSLKPDTDLLKLKITISFSDGEFTAKMCNRASGKYEIAQNILTASGAMTEMACVNKNLMDVEGALMEVLGSGVKAEIKDGLLVLGDDADSRFVFTKVTKDETNPEKTLEDVEMSQ